MAEPKENLIGTHCCGIGGKQSVHKCGCCKRSYVCKKCILCFGCDFMIRDSMVEWSREKLQEWQHLPD